MVAKENILTKAYDLAGIAKNNSTNATSKELLDENTYTALKFNKDINKWIRRHEVKAKSNIARRIKDFIIFRMENIILNLLEKSLTRQSRFNNATYTKILDLEEEVKNFKKSIIDNEGK